MVTLPAFSPVDPRVHSLKIPRRPCTWICVTKRVAIWSNILTNAVTLSKKDILGILKNLQPAHGDSTAPPSPTKETAREPAWPKAVKVWCNSLAMLQPCRHTLIAE